MEFVAGAILAALVTAALSLAEMYMKLRLLALMLAGGMKNPTVDTGHSGVAVASIGVLAGALLTVLLL